MVLVLVGASHHDVTLDEISRLSQSGRSLAKRLTATSDDVSGAVVLSTCNRFEVYLDKDEIRIENWHHDAPTGGEWYTIKPAPTEAE